MEIEYIPSVHTWCLSAPYVPDILHPSGCNSYSFFCESPASGSLSFLSVCTYCRSFLYILCCSIWRILLPDHRFRFVSTYVGSERIPLLCERSDCVSAFVTWMQGSEHFHHTFLVVYIQTADWSDIFVPPLLLHILKHIHINAGEIAFLRL